MKAIYINVTEKSVTEVNMENSLKAIYEKLHCRLMQPVSIGQNQVMLVDEEGRCKKNTPGHFRFTTTPTVFTGHALIVSETDEDFGDVQIPVEKVRVLVEFLDLSEEERPKPKMVFVPVNDVSPESIAKGRAEAARKLAENLNKK